MQSKFVLFLALVTSAASVADGQNNLGETIPPAVLDIRKLEASITLDRAVYIPGEVAKITLRYRNPTDQVLEVIHPFWPGGTGFDLWVKGGPMAVRYGLEYGPIGQHTYADFPPDSSAPTVQRERSTNPILNASPVCPTVESCACVDLRFGQSGGS
jgi:hypothetical protein